MTTDPDDLHALVARHFDGELSDADSARALDHLTVCAQCQAELGDLVGLEVALGREAPHADVRPAGRSPIAAGRRRRWVAPVALVGALAAAAGVVAVVRGGSAGKAAEAPALALAASRAVEVRFTAPAFARYRPYAVERGGGTGEALSLEALARLERQGDLATLAAAQASGGELAAARRALAGMAPGPGRDADLAALELLAGHAEDALIASEQALAGAPTLAAAQWNRALALHGLGLELVAAHTLDQVVAAGEPGWADEARAKVTAWRAALAQRGPNSVAFTSAARAMVDRTGPALTVADAIARPGLTRLYFHDALRGAADAAEARALAPLAAELDRQVGNQLATAAVTRVAALPASTWTARTPLARAYRDLVLGRAADGGAALVARLGRAPAALDDLKLGALVLAGGPSRAAEVERLVAATGDPWFELMVVRDRGRALLTTGALDRAEVVLRGGYARCDGRLWAHRCAHLAIELFTLYASQTRYVEAEAFAGEAVRQFRASGATEPEVTRPWGCLGPRPSVGGRLVLAAATFERCWRASASGRLRVAAAMLTPAAGW
ncbi:MAG: hypothetical protein R3B06_32105 [Kofleriaceae bacterium]